MTLDPLKHFVPLEGEAGWVAPPTRRRRARPRSPASTPSVRPGAQGVNRHGRFGLGVLAPVDEHLVAPGPPAADRKRPAPGVSFPVIGPPPWRKAPCGRRWPRCSAARRAGAPCSPTSLTHASRCKLGQKLADQQRHPSAGDDVSRRARVEVEHNRGRRAQVRLLAASVGCSSMAARLASQTTVAASSTRQ